MLLLGFGCSNPVENTVLKEIISPNGMLKAVVFERNAGSTTAFSTQVSIMPTTDNQSGGGGNIFIADCDHGKAPSASWGGPDVGISWLDDTNLMIRYHSNVRVFKSEIIYDDVKIGYTTN